MGSVLIDDYSFTQIQFSLPIKTLWSAICLAKEVPSEVIERSLEGDLKETLVDEVGFSFRMFGEIVGAWGRMLNPDLWVNAWHPAVVDVLDSAGRVVADDLRHPNEFEIIKRLGGVVVCVERPVDSGGKVAAWKSEGLLNDYPFDDVIVNDGTTEELKELVPAVLARHQIYP